MSHSVRPHSRQPTRLPCPWDPPGKNTGVGCHFLLQCMKVKSESEVAQLCPTPSGPMDCSLPGSSVHRIFQARVLEWGAIAFSESQHTTHQFEMLALWLGIPSGLNHLAELSRETWEGAGSFWGLGAGQGKARVTLLSHPSGTLSHYPPSCAKKILKHTLSMRAAEPTY